MGLLVFIDAMVHHSINFDDLWIDTLTINTMVPEQTFFQKVSKNVQASYISYV